VDDQKLPFIVGGTGLYLSSIIQQYTLAQVDFSSERAKELREVSEDNLKNILTNLNPKLHNTTDLTEKERIIRAIIIAEKVEVEPPKSSAEMKYLIIGLYGERELLKKRIHNRLNERLQNGMIEEVERLLHEGISHEKLRFFGLEYKFLSLYLAGEINYNDMKQKLASAIIQFSKKQMTWFRKMEKEGVKINWLKNSENSEATELIKSFIK